MDAIASLVAGSRAGLTVDSVRVIDGATGQQRRARSDQDSLSSSYLEHAALVERQTQQKVLDLLSYIPGVVVAVTAQVDVTRVTSQTNQHLPMGQGTVSLPRKEEVTENSSVEGGAGSPAGVPGVQSNQAADITQVAGPPGGKTQDSTSVTESENHVGNKTETVVDPRGFPTMVAVSVNVPRGFVTKVLKASQPADASAAGGTATEPTEQQVLDAFEQRIKPGIVQAIKPQVRALTAQGAKGIKPAELDALVDQSVGVALIPMDMPEVQVQSAGLLGSLASGGTGGGILGGGLLDKAILGLLSLAAMGMMFALVRRSSRRIDLPTAEEIVGLPPAIDGGTDIVGEAEESESAMTGIEIGDDTMESHKMLEQVGSMVTQSPESVARLLNRWIEREE